LTPPQEDVVMIVILIVVVNLSFAFTKEIRFSHQNFWLSRL